MESFALALVPVMLTHLLGIHPMDQKHTHLLGIHPWIKTGPWPMALPLFACLAFSR